MAQHVAVLLDDLAEVERLGDHHGSLAGEGAAGVQADHGLVGAERLVNGKVERLEIVLLDLGTVREVDGDARALLKRVREVDLALMRLGLLADEDGDDRLGAPLQQVNDLVTHGRRRRLGDDADDVGGIVVLERHDGVLYRHRADLLVEVAATGADGVHATAAQAVDHAGNLLDTRAGSAHDTDVARVDDVGEGDRHARDNTGAAVGTHEEQALLVRLLLQANLVLERNVVGEAEHVETQIERALKLGSSIFARDGEERHVGVGQLRDGLLPAGRLSGAAGGLLLDRKVGEEGLGLSEHGVHHGLVVGLDDDDHVARVRSLGLIGKQAGVKEDILVRVGAHHDLALDDTVEGVNLVGQQHQVDGVLIRIWLDHSLEHRLLLFCNFLKDQGRPSSRVTALPYTLALNHLGFFFSLARRIGKHPFLYPERK